MSVEFPVVVIGLGYVGLPTATIFAQHGIRTFGVDTDPRKVDSINNGQVPFVEEGLAEPLKAAAASGLLTAHSAIPDVPPGCVYVIAVPTPVGEQHEADLSFIDSATDAIIPHLRGGELVILESTSPPGTTQRIAQRVLEARPDLDWDQTRGVPAVDFAHCPERVLPGRVMSELVTNDRIVGGTTPQAAQRAASLYSVFCQGQIHLTDATTAELAKLVENSYRDVNIAFANELSVISDALGVDVFELIDLANNHPRVNILRPGPGVGGHCVAVDPWFIVSADPRNARLIRTARDVNDAKPLHVVQATINACRTVAAPRIACLGLAFKPDIDDIRESPALHIVQLLSQRLPDAHLLIGEPHLEQLPAALSGLSNVMMVPFSQAVEQADVVVLLVGHSVFAELSPDSLRGKQVLDTTGFFRAS